jgi:hypothetical protein
MTAMNKPADLSLAIAKVETRLEQLLERPLRRLFGGKIEPADLANRLERAMEDGRVVAAGRVLVPNRYEIALHPADLTEFRSFEAILTQELGAYLMNVAQKRGYTLVGHPQIEMAVDTALKPGDISVIARVVDFNPSEPHGGPQYTHRMRVPSSPTVAAPRQSAYLVVHGRRIPLDSPFVTIGRHPDNDLILESKSVSRYHAHIKLRQSRYYLTDLASANGTTVNGKSVTECALQDGDSISFGGTEVVFRRPP